MPPSWSRPLDQLLLLLCLGVGLCCAPGCVLKARQQANRQETSRLVTEAQEALEQGNAQLAADLLAGAVEIDPNDYEVRLQLVELLREGGHTGAAFAHLEEAASRTEDDPRAYFLLAQMLFDQQRFPEAAEQVAKALDLDAHIGQAHLLQGRIAQARGDDELALRAFYAALAEDPHDPSTRFQLGKQLFRRGSTEQAAPLLRRLIEESQACTPEGGEAWWMLGQCYARQERWGEAAQSLAAGIELRQPSALDWRELAQIQYRAGELQAARSSLTLALKLDPRDEQARTLQQEIEQALEPDVRLTTGAAADPADTDSRDDQPSQATPAGLEVDPQRPATPAPPDEPPSTPPVVPPLEEPA
ncbi:MAG: tetratricopeptide repeat protein, partial [Planctomycetaceae bacterium]